MDAKEFWIEKALHVKLQTGIPKNQNLGISFSTAEPLQSTKHDKVDATSALSTVAQDHCWTCVCILTSFRMLENQILLRTLLYAF